MPRDRPRNTCRIVGGNDPDAITPDVPADDRQKYEASGDQKYVDRAHRRGKLGWNVGQQIEVMPH